MEILIKEDGTYIGDNPGYNKDHPIGEGLEVVRIDDDHLPEDRNTYRDTETGQSLYKWNGKALVKDA